MEEKNDIDAKIDAHLEQWQPPFDQHSKADAKEAVMRRIQNLDAHQPVISKSKSRLWFRIAAVVAIVFGTGFAFYYSGSENLINNSKEVRTYVLPDGSEIMATPKSQIAFNSVFWEWDRDVIFSGEGYFKVKSGSIFNVTTKSGEIHVLGTAFTTWANDKRLFVHCTSGSVNVDCGSENTTLTANEFTRIEKGTLSVKQEYDYAGFLYPRPDTQLRFDSVPVGVVIAQLEKSLKIDIKNELPGELLYSGVLDTSDKEGCLRVFCKPFGAKASNLADGSVSIHLK